LFSLSLLIAPAAVLGASPASAATCSNPRWSSSDPNGMWFGKGGYIVHNNMWNAGGYNVSQTISVCSRGNWKVRATASNRSGDGAVKTYPNVHRDWHDWNSGHEPRLSSFRKIRSTFKARTPRVGIYNAAYDIWLNGVPGEHEVMIWTDNYRQRPAGTRVARGLEFGGVTWRLFATSGNHYLAFLPDRRLTSGTVRIKAMLNYLVREGRLPRGVTLGQIGFGFEVVSTGGRPATFKVDRFSLTVGRR
jgi:hypothetical protein